MLPQDGKLVRDRIPHIVRDEGGYAETVTVEPEDLWDALSLKLVEEAQELALSSPAYRLREFADVYEVLITMARHSGIEMRDIVMAAEQRRAQRGGFASRTWVVRFHRET